MLASAQLALYRAAGLVSSVRAVSMVDAKSGAVEASHLQ
jgi:hypothetical protein